MIRKLINQLRKPAKEEIAPAMKVVIRRAHLGEFPLPYFYVINDENQHRWDKKTNTFRSLSYSGTAFDSLEAAQESFATVNQHYIKDYSDNGLLTAREVMMAYKEGEYFNAWVTSNPFGKGKRTKVKFIRRAYELDSCFGDQHSIEGFSYYSSCGWLSNYVGFFEIAECSTFNITEQAIADRYGVALADLNIIPSFRGWN